MDILCRICLEQTTKYTSINSKIEIPPSLTFIDFLNNCTSLNACANDRLPQRLCPMCTNSMKTFYAFVKLAEQSDIILREALTIVIAKGEYNGNGENCEEIPIRNEKLEKEPEHVNKEDSFHCQPNENSTGSSLYILDIVKEEPRISEEGTSIVELKYANKINESETLHSTLDRPEWSLDKLNDMLSYTDRGLMSTDAEHSDSEDDVPISLLKRSCAKNEDGTYSQSNLRSKEHCGSSNMQKTTDKIKTENGEVIKEGPSDPQETDAEFTENIDQSMERNIVLTTTLNYKNKCLVCEKVFKNPSNRWTHMRRTHCGGKFFKCEKCGKQFLFEAEYQSHLRVHVNIDEACSQSGETKKYRLPFELAEQKQYECEMCDEQFSAKEDLNLHLENHKGTTQKCDQCDKEFKHRCSLNRHIRIHTNPKPFKCENCEKSFGWKNNYIKHMEICKRPGEQQQLNRTKFECEICGKKLSSVEYLMIHMDNHMGITQKCDLCDKEFKHKGSLFRHMSYHNNPKRFNCENCQKSLSNKYRYTKHIQICKGRDKSQQLNKTKTECEICGKKFSTKEYLNLHMENHKRIKQKCDQCDREFPTINTLRKHMKWHADPKPFKCENCGKSFATKFLYTRHVDSCTRPPKPQQLDKVKVYCEICGKGFASKGNLKVHMECHTGIAKKCNQCDKEFTTRSALRRHIKWHANPNPYKCKNCGKYFTRKYRCINHMNNCKPLANSIEVTVKVED